MAQITLQPTDANTVRTLLPGDTVSGGATSEQAYLIAPGGGGTITFTANLDGDTVDVDAASTGFTVTRENNTLVLTDGAITIIFPVGAGESTVAFNDNTYTVARDDGSAISFGGTELEEGGDTDVGDTTPDGDSDSDADGDDDFRAVNDNLETKAEDFAPITVTPETLLANDIGGLVVRGIDARFNSVGGTAEFDAATEDIIFTAEADFHGTASFDYLVANANGDTDSATASFTVNPINDAPTVTVRAAVGAMENVSGLTLDPTLTISDDSEALQGATVRISNKSETNGLEGDLLSFDDQSGISGRYDTAAGVLTLVGEATVEEYQAALRSVTFSNPNEVLQPNESEQYQYPVQKVIEWAVNDGEYISDPAFMFLGLTPENDAPVNTVPGDQSVNENEDLVLNGAFSISDVDAAPGEILTVILRFEAGNILLPAVGTDDEDVDAFFGPGPEGGQEVRLFGTVDAINRALDQITYRPPDLDFVGKVRLVMTTLGHGSRTEDNLDWDLVDRDIVTITVNPVDDVGTVGSMTDMYADIA